MLHLTDRGALRFGSTGQIAQLKKRIIEADAQVLFFYLVGCLFVFSKRRIIQKKERL